MMLSIAERENLMCDREPKRSGFTPRHSQRLAAKGKKPPRSMLNVECNHFLRTSTEGTAHGYAPLPYRLWLEAGKHQAPFPERPDPSYNSNVWRNFRKAYGFYTNTEGQDIGEMIATMYPLNIPAPSKVGDYTYSKFLHETPLIKDKKYRQLAIDRTARDLIDFKRMRLKTEMRNPPLDMDGQIVPPINFTKHAYKFVPPPDQMPPSEPEVQAPQGDTRIDIFGNEVPKSKSKSPLLWKLSYKLNNPQYGEVQELIQTKQNQPRRHHPPAFTTSKVH